VSKYRFIIVSNRLPVTVKKEDGKLVFTQSSGGLATAMSSLENAKEALWIGWPGIAEDELSTADKAKIAKELKKYNCYPVHLNADLVRTFYEGYANDTLWPLFHYFQQSAQYREEYWSAYKTANEYYAKAVYKFADPATTVWAHDYHFLLLPALLRKHLPAASIGFFLHIPFPSYEIFRLLPERREILEGMLGADLLGFHIYDYARHFLSSCLRMLGIESSYGVLEYDGRTILTDAFPIGIDYQKFKRTLKNPETKQEIATITDTYKGQKIILSVDRLDYSKGIMQRLEAFDLFLKENPSYHKKVALVMVAVPSRTQVKTYQDLRDSIELLVSRINGTYGTVDWTPVSYQFRNLPFEQVVALYARADVMLVTPLRDGMNLVAKEYVASKQDNKGVLILSELAGAIDELPEAISVNPNNIRSIKNAIRTALKMPNTEKRQRLMAMRRRISSYTVQRWAADFLEQLHDIKQYQGEQGEKILTQQDEASIQAKFTRANKRLFILDYDGTIRNFVASPDPNKAKPPIKLKRLLDKIIAQPNTRLCIVSGRTKQALDGWFKDERIMLVAEHGAWIKTGKNWASNPSSFDEYRGGIMALLTQYADRTAGAEIEEKDFSIVWQYRNVPTELAYVRNINLWRDLQGTLAGSDIGVYSGNKIIEIKPEKINKGEAVKKIIKDHLADFIFCAGDDYTDEDMFTALPESANSIKVGLGHTEAKYQVTASSKLITLLEGMLTSPKELTGPEQQ
jgi:trehalose 6-phosphate synthase/phosphatase